MRITKLIILITVFNITMMASRPYAAQDDLQHIIKEWETIIEKIKSYTYVPPNFDPFQPFIQELKPAPINENITVYFKDYSINELKLVGIVKTPKKIIAIIEDPTGRGMFLKKGDYLGKEGAIITKITPCAVYIAERYVNKKGQIIYSDTPKVLKLYSEEKKCEE